MKLKNINPAKIKIFSLSLLSTTILTKTISAFGGGCDGYTIASWMGSFVLSVKVLLIAFVGIFIYGFIKDKKPKRKLKGGKK